MNCSAQNSIYTFVFLRQKLVKITKLTSNFTCSMHTHVCVKKYTGKKEGFIEENKKSQNVGKEVYQMNTKNLISKKFFGLYIFFWQ